MTPVVLALRALGLGDALTGVPALRGLRRRFPGAHLVLGAPAPLGTWLVGQGVVDAVLPVEGIAPLAPDALVAAVAQQPRTADGGAATGLGATGVDVAVNLHGNGEASAATLAALHPRATLAFASAGHPGGETWDADEHEVLRWCRLVSSHSPGTACGPADLVLRDEPASAREDVVVLHPGAASASRRWPPQRWVALAQRWAVPGPRGADLGAGQAPTTVVLTGSAAEAGLCATIAERIAESTSGVRTPAVRDLSGALDLPALTDLVARARLLVCGDTGVAHLATATRTPSVLLFGPTPPGRWGPVVDADRHRVLWPAPAGYRGDPHAGVLDPVLARIGVDDVLAAARWVGGRVAAHPATGPTAVVAG